MKVHNACDCSGILIEKLPVSFHGFFFHHPLHCAIANSAYVWCSRNAKRSENQITMELNFGEAVAMEQVQLVCVCIMLKDEQIRLSGNLCKFN